MKKKQAPQDRTRHIVTEYISGRRAVKVTKAHYQDRAISTAVRHMQFDDYAAGICQIYNDKNGKLLGVIRRNVKGDIRVQFRAK